jgi:hypothetical protein
MSSFPLNYVLYNIVDSSNVSIIGYNPNVPSPWNLVVPSTVTYLSNTYNVTSISDSAFSNCTALVDISFQIPSNITYLGDFLFVGCSNLTSLQIPDSVTSTSAVVNRSSLVTVVFSNNMNTITSYFAQYCSNLVNVTIGSGTTIIENYSFHSCSNLKNFTFLGTVTPIINDEYGFTYAITNPVAYLQPNCYNYLSLTTYFTTSNINSINNVTFTNNNIQYTTYAGSANNQVYVSGCTNSPSVTTLNIPNTVTNNNITYNVYYIGVSYDTTIIIDSSYVTTINIPYDVSYINSNILRGCSALTNFNVDSNNIYYSSYGGFILDISQTTIIITAVGVTTITETSFPSTVTTLGNYTFNNCIHLTNVTLPSTITTFGDYIFNGCSSLTSIIFSSALSSLGNYTFNGCSSLNSIIIPNTITSLGNNIFNNCAALTDISFQIPSNITYLGDFLFVGCSSLTTFTIPNSVTSTGSVANTSSLVTIVFSNNMNTIMNNFAQYCSNLVNVTIGTGTTSIENQTFHSCTNLKNFTFLGTVTPIINDQYSFTYAITNPVAYLQPNCYNYLSLTTYFTTSNINSVNNVTFTNNNIQYTTYAGSANNQVYVSGCTNSPSVTTLNIPNTVTNNDITYNVYYIGVSYDNTVIIDSSYVTTINIPYDISYINSNVFSGCSVLTYFNVDSNNIYYSSYGGFILNVLQTTILLSPTGLTTITETSFPSTVTTLGNYTFNNCIYLTNVTLPSTVTTFGDYIFNGCSSLTSIIFSSALSSLGNYTFNGCSSLTSIIIPNTLTSLGDYTFNNCTALVDISFQTPCNITYLGNFLFVGCSSLTTFTIPNSITSTGAVVNSSSLVTIVFSNNMNTITSYFAQYCSNLVNVTIGTGTTIIENYTFHSCSNLKNFTFLGTVTPIINDEYGFTYAITNPVAYLQANCYNYLSLTTYFTTSNINSVNNVTFTNNNIQYTTYAGSANNQVYVSGCTNSPSVTTLNIPNTVTNNDIIYNVYYIGVSYDTTIVMDSSYVTTIIIPYDISYINSNVFSGCSVLTNLYFLGYETPTIYGDVLYWSTIKAYVYRNSNYSSISVFVNSENTFFVDPPCFKTGSKILTKKGYIPIEQLRKGDLIKTIEDGYLPIYMIGKREIYHPNVTERIKQQLYVCSHSKYPEVFEDLILTGCHSILVHDYVSEEERQHTIEVNGDTYVTGHKYRLPACADKRTTVYDKKGNYTIYHLALENDSYYHNYGIYANGLLVESCSKRYLKECSNMTIIE